MNLYAYCANNPVTYYDPSGYSSYEHDGKAEADARKGNVTAGEGGGGAEGETIHNDILDKPRIGSALTIDKAKPVYKVDPETGNQYLVQEFPAGVQAHGFDDMIDNYAGYATKSPIPNGEIYQLDGSLNGTKGRFEWIVQDGQVTHRMFIKDGTMNGVPIIP